MAIRLSLSAGKRGLLCLAFSLLFWTGISTAAKLIQPPIQDMFKERNQIAVLELKSINKEEARGEFSKVKDLWGESPDQISIKIGSKWVERLQPGQRYIIGYSEFRKHPLLRDEIQPNPDGAAVLHPYVVTDAIFDDSEALRDLIRAHQKEKKKASQILSMNLDLLTQSEANTRLLAAFQFQMSSDMYADGLKDKHLKQVQESLTSGKLTAEESEFLVRAAQYFPDGKRPDWIADYCRKTVEEHASPYDLQSFVPLLVKTCTTTLGKDGNKEDLPRLSKLLLTNSPGVAKGALRAIEALAGEETPQLIANVLKDNPMVHGETQGILSTYLYEYSKRQEGAKGGY